jgi:membrane-associated phospholipid phosphatase
MERERAGDPADRGTRAHAVRVPVASAIAALIAAVALGQLVRAHPVTALDATVQTWMLAHQEPHAVQALRWITILGGITAMRVLAACAAALLVFRRAWLIAAGLILVPLVSVPVFNLLKSLYGRPRPLGLGALAESDGAFPSGHATIAAAVCGAVGWALWRTGVIGKGPALAIAIVPPLLVGISRVYLNVHWTTDVIGGWCIGGVIATVFVALSDRSEPRMSS